MRAPACRLCGAALARVFCDLGMAPLSNAFLAKEQLEAMEPFYPLKAYVCADCLLVQLQAFETPERIFADYAYYSSFSDTWLEHARQYAATVSRRLKLGAASLVVEVASNDGYLLREFRALGIPVLGVEPAANVAAAAIKQGIPTLVEFFGARVARRLVEEGRRADLLVGNNVLAHVPELNDFIAGLKILLGEDGVLTMEFPHLLHLIRENQFDTIYHEHFSYFSLATAKRAFEGHGLRIYDVEEIPTHGGSLRIFACHAQAAGRAPTLAVAALLEAERRAGLERIETYEGFQQRVQEAKRGLLEFLVAAKRSGKKLVGYGAPAKANTLLNYCGIRQDFIDFTVDRSPHKQGKYLPGTHIPVYAPERIRQERPDYILVLPWNLKDEILRDLAYVREWGARFVIPIPQVQIVD